MEIFIADKSSDAKELAEFFNACLTPDYISHQELQGYRAVAPGVWAKDVLTVLEHEIRERLREPCSAFPPTGNWQGVIVAEEQETLIGLSLVTISRLSAIPYGIVEDIVINSADRGHAKGDAMMRWIIEHFQRAGIKRIFLESGITNERAHHFFERLGFKQTSIVMILDALD